MLSKCPRAREKQAIGIALDFIGSTFRELALYRLREIFRCLFLRQWSVVGIS